MKKEKQMMMVTEEEEGDSKLKIERQKSSLLIGFSGGWNRCTDDVCDKARLIPLSIIGHSISVLE